MISFMITINNLSDLINEKENYFNVDVEFICLTVNTEKV